MNKYYERFLNDKSVDDESDNKELMFVINELTRVGNFDDFKDFENINTRNFILKGLDFLYDENTYLEYVNFLRYKLKILSDDLKKSNNEENEVDRLYRIIENLKQKENLNSKDLFDKIRYEDYSDYQLTSLLKTYSDNYNLDLLDSLRKDIWLYIETEKEDLECSFDPFGKEEAVNEWVKKGKEIPYLERKSFEELNENQKAKRLKLNIEIEPTIDFEKIMFPFEFYSLRNFQLKIVQKIDEIESNLSLENFDDNIFKSLSAFKLFLEYNKNITSPYIDYSFIFQQMKHDKLIHEIKHRFFINWLIDNQFIKGKIKDDFEVKGELRSLEKSTSSNRLNNYLNLKERFII